MSIPVVQAGRAGTLRPHKWMHSRVTAGTAEAGLGLTGTHGEAGVPTGVSSESRQVSLNKAPNTHAKRWTCRDVIKGADKSGVWGSLAFEKET